MKTWYKRFFFFTLNSTPLTSAFCSGRTACVEALISWGADVDYDIPHLGTPLYIACASRELQCTQKLLDGGLGNKSCIYEDRWVHRFQFQRVSFFLVVYFCSFLEKLCLITLDTNWIPYKTCFHSLYIYIYCNLTTAVTHNYRHSQGSEMITRSGGAYLLI